MPQVDLNIPSSVVHLGKDAFADNLALESITFARLAPDARTAHGAGSTGNTGNTGRKIAMGDGAFRRCRALRSVTIPGYAPSAVQFHHGGGQFDFVWAPARTPHRAYA